MIVHLADPFPFENNVDYSGVAPRSVVISGLRFYTNPIRHFRVSVWIGRSAASITYSKSAIKLWLEVVYIGCAGFL